MPDQANNEGGNGGTPAAGGETMIVRLDVPYSDLAPEVQNQYMMAVANCVGAMMPPGPDPAGRAMFFLLIPDVDQSGKLPYITNADARTLAPSLRLLAARFAGPNPDQLAATETVVGALRRLSDAVEAIEAFKPGTVDPNPKASPGFNRQTVQERGALLIEYDAARSHAMEVLDALAPDVVTPKVRIEFRADTVRETMDATTRRAALGIPDPHEGGDRTTGSGIDNGPIPYPVDKDSDHAPETVPPGTTGDDHDRRSDVHGEDVRPGTDDARARPGRGDPEPFRTRPRGDAV